MARVEGSTPARRVPATAAAIVNLLNSRPHSPARALPDTLQTPEGASAVLRPFGQPDGVAPSTGRIAKIRDLRGILMDIVSAPDTTQAALGWEALTERTSSVTLRQVFSAPGKAELEQVDGDPVVGRVILAVAELVTDGTWRRIRTCANEMCAGVFYDTTRSRTQRWHSYEVCGNKTNVAAYRARKKAATERK
ncbi:MULTISPECIES: CGNR zinc finger domain-containing protein [Streptomyces]|uniref:CGNR zinc finger domain-containing protein n=1 Tax=Streptomyces TaxID=1883 RepID=UPI00142DD0F8|nr:MULTISPECIES: CGNR zinc finger domain-containing protein [Streptomyces]